MAMPSKMSPIALRSMNRDEHGGQRYLVRRISMRVLFALMRPASLWRRGAPAKAARLAGLLL
jgi:hypothetical protein